MENQFRQHPSPTGRMVDGHLTPLPDAVSADTVVWFALPVETGADQTWEGLAATLTAEDAARLRAVPLFAHNLNYDDEVTVMRSAEGAVVATAKVSDSGNHTFRLWLGEGGAATLPQVITEFGRLGCLIEGYSERLLGLSCSADQVEIVERALRAAEGEGRLVYERGRQ